MKYLSKDYDKTMAKVRMPFFWILSVVLLMGACRKFNPFDPIPVIEYKSHYFKRSQPLGLHMLHLEMTFRDGDGDIGLSEGDTLPPFDISSPFYHNLWIELFTIKNSLIVDTFNFNARIPNITPPGQVKSLEGEIQYEIPIDGLAEGDTIRVGIRLVDRALNVSARSFSPEIVVKRPQ
ncbi:MAG: hypothetical protein ACK4EX_05865 [Thermaurantimonas sp.]|uniref:hypothetical protein n=1 Tax=Thermaurantimonas sp. TaxID=2681568 RepID=UPI003919E913